MKRLNIALFCAAACVSVSPASAQYDPNLLPHAATNAVLATWPTAAYNAVMRDGQSVAGDVPPLLFVPETGTCVANGKVSDGVNCLNTTAGDGNSWFNANILTRANTWSARQGFSATGAGSTVYPIDVVNTSGIASSGAGIFFDPGAVGVGTRGAYVTATNNGGNQVTMHLGVANAGPPADAVTLNPDGSSLFSGGPTFNSGYWNGGTNGQVFTINTSGFGLSNPPNSTVLYIRGPDGVGALVDLFNYTGSASANQLSPTFLQQTRSGINGNLIACPKGQWVAQWGAKTYNGVSETSDAYMVNMCTETQTGSANGMGYQFLFKLNGASNVTEAMAISREGLGGITIGNVDSGTSLPHVEPFDLGAGTINALGDIATENHFVSRGHPGTITGCGSGATITTGSDVAAVVSNGSGSVTSCEIDFNSAFTLIPICIVQIFNAASPTIFVSSETVNHLIVTFGSSFNGQWQYHCIDSV